MCAVALLSKSAGCRSAWMIDTTAAASIPSVAASRAATMVRFSVSALANAALMAARSRVQRRFSIGLLPQHRLLHQNSQGMPQHLLLQAPGSGRKGIVECVISAETE